MGKVLTPEIYNKRGVLPSGSNVEILTLPNDKAFLLQYVFGYTPELQKAFEGKFDIEIKVRIKTKKPHSQ